MEDNHNVHVSMDNDTSNPNPKPYSHMQSIPAFAVDVRENESKTHPTRRSDGCEV